ncbi:hypothetical protein CYMTET_56591 [Cymbomonas tetramitiformis]|uniref:Uncharacterized protein n=1 Tax=Cymbomonas tetramitiformis TaxID=36881 RepID=A0AAE0BC33_9CHLO|nr:hypothetical protein CYMTET_56591 [Cymbomonas tetramitiformis]
MLALDCREGPVLPGMREPGAAPLLAQPPSLPTRVTPAPPSPTAPETGSAMETSSHESLNLKRAGARKARAKRYLVSHWSFQILRLQNALQRCRNAGSVAGCRAPWPGLIVLVATCTSASWRAGASKTCADMPGF